MKRIFTFAFAAFTVLSINAQIRIWENGRIAYEKDLSAIDSITFVRNTPVDPEFTRVELLPDSMELVVGNSLVLHATLYPAKDITINFYSEDSSIAEVDADGIVTAKSPGVVNIIAYATSAIPDTCVVTVTDPNTYFAWGGMALWNLDKSTFLSNDTMEITLSSGLLVHCLPVPAAYRIWDTGFSYTPGVGLSGAGYTMYAESSVLLIIDSIDENGRNYYYYGRGDLTFVDPDTYNRNDTAFVYCAPAGKITGSGTQHYAWLIDSTGLVLPAYTGTQIDYWNIDDDWYSSLDGFSGTGSIYGNENEVQYKWTAKWFDGPYGWGLVVEEQDGMYDFKQPYEWAPMIERYYEKLDEDYAPVRHAKKAGIPNRQQNTDLLHSAKTMQQPNKQMKVQAQSIK